MKIVFLGTNGWYDTSIGNTICVLIETKSEYVILDAGNGIYKIDRYIKTPKPIYLFLSHFHLDHIIGLHVLSKFDFSQGIVIYGPAGIEKVFKNIINDQYSMPIEKLKTRVELNELNHKIVTPVNVQYKKLTHPTVCYGYRFVLENKIVSYCTDTGVCKNLLLLATDADLLIAESSLESGVRDEVWPHLNPEDAALVAKNSGAQELALIHFDASIYRNLEDRKYAEKKAQNIFINTLSAFDDMELLL